MAASLLRDDDRDMANLAQRYCPRFQFSEKERYLPASFEHICKHAPLTHGGEPLPGASPEALRASIASEVAGGEPTLSHRLIWRGTDDGGGKQGRDEALRFDIGVVHRNTAMETALALLTGELENDGYAGPPDPSNKLYGDPMAPRQYLHAHVMGRFRCKETGVEMVDIVYGVYFMFNGTLESHAFDIEYAVLRFQYYDPGQPFGYHHPRPMVEEPGGGGTAGPRWHLVRVYLSAHGNGVWYPTSFPGEEETTLRFVDGTHPVIYSANASHAMYPSAKRNKRFMGFADDVTDDGGLLWRPTHLVVWGPAMFPSRGGAQVRPSGEVLRVADGARVEMDPLLYLNFFRGTFGALEAGKGCPGCQASLPFKEALNLLSAGDGYYKFQRGGIQAVVSVGTSPAFRSGVWALNLGCIVAVMALVFLAGRQLGQGNSKAALQLVRWTWLPLVVSVVSAPLSTLVHFS